jgi:hypothetical protein
MSRQSTFVHAQPNARAVAWYGYGYDFRRVCVQTHAVPTSVIVVVVVVVVVGGGGGIILESSSFQQAENVSKISSVGKKVRRACDGR